MMPTFHYKITNWGKNVYRPVFFRIFVRLMEEILKNTKEVPAFRKRLTPERARLLYRQIVDKMKKDKTYRNPDYTVRMLADELQTNTRYIAIALAVAGETSYNQLVNDLRLREVCKYFKSPVYAERSLQDIGMMAGFASRQAFYLAFRKAYHCTPKDFREKIKQ